MDRYKTVLVNGKNYFNEESFNKICELLEHGKWVEVFIDCIGHTRNNNEQEKYKQDLMKKYGDSLEVNIITILEKEIEKNNLYMDVKGNTITPEKIEAMAKKSYIADLKAGNIDFAKTFEDYHLDILGEYIPTCAVISSLKNIIRYGSVHEPVIPEPEAESVAI